VIDRSIHRDPLQLAIVAGAFLPVTALAQASTMPSAPSIFPMLLAFALVLGLIPVAMWALKRFGGTQALGTHTAGLKIVSQLPLGARERIVVLEAGDRWLLLGVTANNIQRIGTLPKGETPTATAPPFAALLARVSRTRT